MICSKHSSFLINFIYFYGYGIWHSDKDNCASNWNFVLYLSDCKLLCGCVPWQGGATKKSCHLCSVCDTFPQLVAGPIVRYSEIEHTLTEGIDFSQFHVKFRQGVVRFAVGLGKKVLIANVIGEFVAEVAALGTRNLALSWAYAIAVSLQIYFDFSGYSDMAIGLGGILGFSFPENFRYPFISRSVTEFWRRWHITLGAWFRDYVYIPMGGNRVRMSRWILNILVVWLFTGLWHGAGWNFIAWGLLFAVLLVMEKGVSRLFGDKKISVSDKNEEYIFKQGWQESRQIF